METLSKLVEAFVPMVTYAFIVGSSLVLMLFYRQLQKRKKGGQRAWREKDTPLSGEGEGGDLEQRRAAKRALSTRLMRLYRVNFGESLSLAGRLNAVAFDNLPVASVLYYLSYKLILASLFDTLKCKAFEEDLEPRLVAAKYVLCSSDAYKSFFVVALLIIIFYVGLLPLIVIVSFGVLRERYRVRLDREILDILPTAPVLSKTKAPTATPTAVSSADRQQKVVTKPARTPAHSPSRCPLRLQQSGRSLDDLEAGEAGERGTSDMGRNKDRRGGEKSTLEKAPKDFKEENERETGEADGDAVEKNQTSSSSPPPPLTFEAFYSSARMKENQLNRIFSFLIAGYKDKYFYWEVVVMFRAFTLETLMAFSMTADPDSRIFPLLLHAACFLILQTLC
eukprot:Cvel_25114.t1-p1 / transcript=Cvel_25114.t1 / gene=Cvel_25114 / organism=Chromera_velia_CCMP2878 / gene_product=hypothetical protein / transcript_product=hypothetical protein / location=Cvel_scaffold2802:20703-23521(+) / protein_length=393 / sequence_SO=supercontig / SO=protein_coding / is_pseudo=false